MFLYDGDTVTRVKSGTVTGIYCNLLAPVRWISHCVQRKSERMSKRNPGDEYRKGSSVYRAEDSRGDDRGRDRSPLRSDDRCEATNYSQADAKKQKLTFAFAKKGGAEQQKKGIQIKLGSTSKPTVKATPVQRPTVASVFNTDEEDEPEEMPAEARMRMRNIGRETPTSAGPNSFGKTKQGFCDSKKIFEKTLKKAMEEANK